VTRDVGIEDLRLPSQFEPAAAAEPATCPVTAKRKEPSWAKVPMWLAKAATEATKDMKAPAALVWIHMLHASWKAKGAPFLLPNVSLRNDGASRLTKYRVLRKLEAAGLITVERRGRKSPLVRWVART
jgi:DNA-binding transcriptional ArsR family regulator